METSKLLVPALLLILCSTGLQAQHDWHRTNPGGGGAFTSVGAGPTGTILVGSDLSGAYISMDNGASWEVIGASRGMDVTHVSGIGFDPTDEEVMFIATESGIFRSADHGNTFLQTRAAGYVTDISVSSSNPAVVFASEQAAYNSNDAYVVKSTNGGLSWNVVSTDFPAERWIIDLEVDPEDPQTVYALTGRGRWICRHAAIYKSTNGGVNWSNITSGIVGKILDFKLSPDDPSTIYASTMNANCNAQFYWTDLQGDLYKSTNGGATWTDIADRTGVILLDPDDSQSIRLTEPRQAYPWITEAGTWSSVNGGQSWSHTGPIDDWDLGYQVNQYHAYGVPFDGLNRTIGRDMSDPDRLFWINKQWVYESEDRGDHFSAMHTNEVGEDMWRSTGIDNVNMMDIAFSPVDHDKIYVGYFDIGFWRSLDGAESWQAGNDSAFAPGWDGQGGNVHSIQADPTRPSVVWATMSDAQNGASGTSLVKSDEGGQRDSWALSNSGLPVVEVMGISVAQWSPENQRTLMCTAMGQAYLSTDDGASWQQTLTGNGGLRFTAFDQFDSDIRYAGGESGFYRTVDGGASWSQVALSDFEGNSTFWGWGFEGIFDIETDPVLSGRVYATMFGENKGLYRSDDSGATWEHLIEDDFMRCVSISPDDHSIIYATSSRAFDSGHYNANSNGIYYSEDGGQTFSTANGDMAWTFGVPVEVIGEKVFVGSPGTGIQWSYIPGLTNCPSDLNDDGLVDINDFILFNSTYANGCDGCSSDIDGDGQVTVGDFLILNSSMGTTCQ